MAKRRRCKDKLLHHEHEWYSGNELKGVGYSRRTLPKRWAASRLHPVYWCPGISLQEASSEQP